MAYSTHVPGQEIGRGLRTPIKSEVMFYQVLGRALREPRFAKVVYDGAKHHYMQLTEFWAGPVVSEWIVPGTSERR